MQFVFVLKLEGQEISTENYHSFSYQQTFGKILKHSPNFIPETKGLTTFYEVAYSNRFLKPKAWKKYHNFPEFKVSMLYARYGNRSIFGDSFNTLLGLDYNWQNSKWNHNFTYQFGINYSFKPYNVVTNAINNVIGSNINLTAKLTYGFEYFIYSNFSAGLNATIMHHSNGNLESPNLGINVAGAAVSLKWLQPKKHIIQNETPTAKLKKAHQFGIALAFARHERSKPYNGPKYSIYGVQFFANKRLNPLLQLNYGIDITYHLAVVQSRKNIDVFVLNEFAKAVRWYPYAGIELLYGNFGFATSIGFYPVSNNKLSTRIPSNFGANYYFKNLDNNPKNNIKLSVSLKTHFANADYVAFLLGYIF